MKETQIGGGLTAEHSEGDDGEDEVGDFQGLDEEAEEGGLDAGQGGEGSSEGSEASGGTSQAGGGASKSGVEVHGGSEVEAKVVEETSDVAEAEEELTEGVYRADGDGGRVKGLKRLAELNDGFKEFSNLSLWLSACLYPPVLNARAEIAMVYNTHRGLTLESSSCRGSDSASMACVKEAVPTSSRVNHTGLMTLRKKNTFIIMLYVNITIQKN